MIAVEHLRSVLSYEPETGFFTWVKLPPNQRKHLGAVAGSASRQGYISIKMFNRSFSAHRLAWAHFYGEWPNMDVDHINGDKQDNRICNLRLATDQQNSANSRVFRNHSVGLKGATRIKCGWQAQIKVNGKSIYLGVYKTPELAHAAYCAAAVKYFGEYARFA